MGSERFGRGRAGRWRNCAERDRLQGTLRPAHSRATDLVVYSDATAADNPEHCRAAALKLPCLSYFECLGSISRQSRTAAIAGTHGKSTVTAMTATMLAQGGHDLTAIYGAEPLDEDIASRGGRGELMLVEACEYRENFLSLRAQVAAILSIESDHFDYYRSPEQLERASPPWPPRFPRRVCS